MRKKEEEALQFKEQHMQNRLLDVKRKQVMVEDALEQQKLEAAIFEEQMNQKFLVV